MFADSGALRTSLTFLHLTALLGGGGAAIVEDRAVIWHAPADDEMRRRRAHQALRAHRIVVGGLAVLVMSGVLLFAADLDFFLHSWLFWVKMGFIALLAVNGAWLASIARAIERGEARLWPRLRATAVVSLTLWLSVTLLGAALPNL